MLGRNHWIGIVGITGMLLTPLGVGAEEPSAKTPPVGAAPPAWSDAHMRSKFVKPSGKATRPAIQGSSGYGALAAGTSETRMRVPENLESATQRDWEQGPLKAGGQTQPSQKASRGGSGISRGSAIRSGAKSGGRSRGRR